MLVCSLIYIENNRYNGFLQDYKKDFADCSFSEANSRLLADENYNPVRAVRLNRDLSDFFDAELNELSTMLQDPSKESEAMMKLNQIQQYGMVSEDRINEVAANSQTIKNSAEHYNKGIECFNKKDYETAMNYFSDVSPLDKNYTDALAYIRNSKSKILEDIFKECDALAEKEYYTKAIETLNKCPDCVKNSSEVSDRIKELEQARQNYYYKSQQTAEASAKPINGDINSSNINALGIESKTDYLVNVNIDDQKTYVYKGNKDNWTLEKTFPCSTGTDGEETPEGSFTIKEKGDWFFSDKYKQGGKYWTQIVGNILFHSVPYDKDQKTVLDTTLNTPSSHGCIRLSLDDSKWIYDNIPRNSKVIIK